MTPFEIGFLLGSIVITGLVSRILIQYAFKTEAPIQKAFIVALITLVICTGLGSINLGFAQALLMYGIGTFVWLVFDLINAQRQK